MAAPDHKVRFSEAQALLDYGFANWDGTLNTGGFTYDPWGRIVFYHWNGMVARGLITDGAYYYSMDTTDGHYLGSFPVN